MYKEITDADYRTEPYTQTRNKNIYILNENGVETYLSLEGWNHHFLGKLDTNKKIEELKKQVEEEYRIKEEEEKRNKNLQNNDNLQGSNTNCNCNTQNQCNNQCSKTCDINANETLKNKNKKGKNTPINVTYYVSNRPKNRYLDIYKNVKLPKREPKTKTGLAKISTGELASTLKSQGSGEPTIANINPGYTSLKEYPAPKFN
jgi:RecA-family ATPase